MGYTASAADLTFEHHGPMPGNHYRIIAVDGNDKSVGMHEYKVSDAGLHPLPSTSYRRRPEVDTALHAEMQRRHPGLPVVGDEAASPAPKEPEPDTWYHGTTVPRLRHVLPADKHRGGVIFPHVTDRGHAYATTNVDDAWDYAEKAFSSGHGHQGHPRVYEVQPMGHYEKDPETDDRGQARGNWSKDYRSRDGWKVTRELPMPEHMGRPEEWR